MLISVLYFLPKRRWGIQEDDYRTLGAPTLRYLDPGTDCWKCDIYGTCSGCGIAAEKQMEAGTWATAVKNAS
jgi:hypothetical protein